MATWRRMKLDLGCGKHKLEGYLGLDINPDSEAEIIHDLEDGIPLPQNCAISVYCSHFLEHVSNPAKLIKEIYKVCQDKAQVIIKVPLNCKPFGLPDPQHKVELDYDWVSKYMDSDKFLPTSYLLDKVTTKASMSGHEGEEFTYEQATAIFKVKKEWGKKIED